MSRRELKILCLAILLAIAGCGGSVQQAPDASSGTPDSASQTPDAPSSTCTDGAACTSGADPSVCSAGVCGPCADGADDAACAAAYGAGNKCVGGACVAAQCSDDSQCGGKSCVNGVCVGCTDDAQCTDAAAPVCNTTSGVCVAATQCSGVAAGSACPVNAGDLCCGSGPETCQAVECCGTGQSTCGAGNVCSSGQCVASTCGTVTDHVYHVDSTATKPGNGTATCPARHIQGAIDLVLQNGDNKTNEVKISVSGPINETTQGAGTFPITVPGHIHIVGADDANRPLVTVPLDTSAFIFASAAPGGISSLKIRPAAGTQTKSPAAVWIKNTLPGGNPDAAGDDNVNVNHIDIQGFTYGILVDQSGYVGLGQDVSSQYNTYGLRLTNGFGRMVVPAGNTPSHFDHNGDGIHVGVGSVFDLTGADTGTGTTQTITASFNADEGVYWNSIVLPKANLAQHLGHLNANDNGGNGLLVYTPSVVVVRNTTFLRNFIGAFIAENNGMTSTALIDLGNIGATGAGHNTFDNNKTGVCASGKDSFIGVEIEGNSFSGHDCSVANPGYKLTSGTVCGSGGNNLGYDKAFQSFSVAHCTQ